MIRGITKFKCEKCGTVFEAPDIELGATVRSQPMACPKCGNMTDKHAGLLDRLFGKK